MNLFQIDSDVECLSLLSVMLKPNDHDAIRINGILFFTRQERNRFGNIDEKIVQWALEDKIQPLESLNAGKNLLEGSVTGDLLHYLFCIDYAGIEEPSLKKARWLTSTGHKRAVHAGEHWIGYSDSAIKDYWRQYKRVAHLWAAYRCIKMADSDFAMRGDSAIRLMHGKPRLFLSIAKAYQEYADSFRSSRNKNPARILPFDAWRISDDITPLPLSSQSDAEKLELADWMKDSLEQYRNA